MPETISARNARRVARCSHLCQRQWRSLRSRSSSEGGGGGGGGSSTVNSSPTPMPILDMIGSSELVLRSLSSINNQKASIKNWLIRLRRVRGRGIVSGAERSQHQAVSWP